jgi:hypothetical protein
VKRETEELGDMMRDTMYMIGEISAELIIVTWEMITGILESTPFPHVPEMMIV